VCALSPHNSLLAALVRVFDTFEDVRMTLSVVPLRTPCHELLIFQNLMTQGGARRLGFVLASNLAHSCLAKRILSQYLQQTCLQFL